MAPIKLACLPDRTPTKLTFSATPDLIRDLEAYADAYEAAYARKESIVELIPAMLITFLESDRGFMRAKATRTSGAKPS